MAIIFAEIYFMKKVFAKTFLGFLLIACPFFSIAQCDPVPTANLNYVSGTGASCVWNYSYSISYTGTSFDKYQFSLSCNGGSPSTITALLALLNGVTTGTTNNFICPCTSGTSFALTVSYTVSGCGGCGLVCSEPVNSLVLPVRISSFQLKTINNSPCLLWRTEIEDNIDYYEVEYSANGVDYFSIGKTNSLNNPSGANYTVCDIQNRTSGFYRIKIKELDGKTMYSEIIRFVTRLSQANIYPNPAKNKLFLTLPSSGIFAQANYKIYSSTGTRVLQGKMLQNYILVSTLPAGVYYLELKNEENILLKKMFIKN